jgi:GGDEF domain-containing protein
MAEEVVRQRLKIGSREGFETSLLFIDLDNFKAINDTLSATAYSKRLPVG